ncbi:sensor/response regulator hybrid [Mesorhizobium sp. CU2]|uniref:ATP-binding protein n=1 Tax=unclassified Mesorhizobium TaxID=325217 RepID=UPI00112C79EE|nr:MULTISPECIES: ATP-binding protein [unclassified Mesorhizobium]TPN83244.1 sensor/response regulator hybrid [Mesorhizobium sp. CU3]TPO15880.1 sensor/response regulator hybrid [Mesorhizobium sp. CU2]
MDHEPLDIDSRIAADGSAAAQARLASIVHDFNNFLTPIVSILIDLQRQKVGSEKQMRRIDGAIFCAYRAGILTRQLLDNRHALQANPGVVHVGELLARFEPVMAGAIGSDVALRVETSADLPPVQFDEPLLERALLNLVLNARDAMPDGGNLVVAALLERPVSAKCHHADFMVRLSISDSGIGMSEAILEQVGQSRFSTKAHGSGLGLMTVRQSLEHQNGLLSITSAEGSGTTVNMWLPLARLPSKPASPGSIG